MQCEERTIQNRRINLLGRGWQLQVLCKVNSVIQAVLQRDLSALLIEGVGIKNKALILLHWPPSIACPLSLGSFRLFHSSVDLTLIFIELSLLRLHITFCLLELPFRCLSVPFLTSFQFFCGGGHRGGGGMHIGRKQT